jgi:acyl-CoA reductase-like NAD-dependent aldehyde dehydrogenase
MNTVMSFASPVLAEVHALLPFSHVSVEVVQGCQIVGALIIIYVGFKLSMKLLGVLAFIFEMQPPQVVVELTEEESENVLEGYPKFKYDMLKGETSKVHLWDPSTLDYFGHIPVMRKKEVDEIVARAHTAQEEWKKSSFKTRRLLMRTMQRYVTENIENCARVAVRDSGKTMLDAVVGEVLTTAEKLSWLANSGEQYLQPEWRDTGRMMVMKTARVEFDPLGVIGAIVPWNYPFHNVFNPVSAALFTGNAIVIKVSEYASWSIDYYKRVIDGCLDAVGAPRDLVQFVVGYGETGAALVDAAVDKIIFVGSPEVGAIVARSASKNLTPVVLELGGKDPFVICEDADIDAIVQTAARGVWGNMGQNCAGPERFFVYESVHDDFSDKMATLVDNMTTGASLGNPFVDCGAICMGPNQLKKYQALVDDAVKKGARCLAGGKIPKGKRDALTSGSFYPPTVLADVPEHAIIAQEEIFGPIMCIFKVHGDDDAEAVRMANNCDFALSSTAFSGSTARAKKLGRQLNAGMQAVNDLEGCTYMNQSLPFGGCKKSGYDRFAGPEGLRGLCNIRSICEDRVGFIRNAIPPPMHYPATGNGFNFASGLLNMFYSTSLLGNLKGVYMLMGGGNTAAAGSDKDKED